MMKRTVMMMAAVALAAALQAQRPVRVETFRLDNGLKVVMCEEHSQPQIYGCVVVHAGSKDENPNATGVAHYFEHMMFKGTDRIGTTNWAAEHPYLDSISEAYDRLQAAPDLASRQAIQREVNRLNVAASRYAIPNEVDAILQRMGCTDLNAGTSYDYTVYYNTLPSNQLSNWMDVYVERFRRPVFRLFQTELEAVYEEKNMYENQVGYAFSRHIFGEAFGQHPYSRDVIGLAKHLKNPQPSEMQKFYDTYYVPNNMTLLLVGDFDTKHARQLVELKFAEWERRPLPQRPAYELPGFEGQKVVEVRQTPVKMGLMVFPGVPTGHRDRLPLEMMASMLGGGSGLLDKAAHDGRLMAAALMPLALNEAGSNVVLYVPKLLGQSHQGAEQVVWDCIDSIANGHFSDDLMESIKTASLADRQRMTEDRASLAQLLLQLELEGSDYGQWQRDNARWAALTRDEIMEVAARYFNPGHCTLVRSKMGFPKNEEAVKPEWEHLEAQNQNERSDFARMIEVNQPEPLAPQVVDFGRDVAVTPVAPHCRLYSARNPKNDIFELTVTYRYGLLDNPDLGRACDYMEALGADGRDRTAFSMALDQLGGYCSLECGTEESRLRVGGLEENRDSIMALAARWLFRPTHDERQIVLLVDAIRGEAKAAKEDPNTWLAALDAYAHYGSRSPYLAKTPYKAWGRRSGEELHHEVMQMLRRNGYATFTGNSSPEELCRQLHSLGLVRDSVEVVGRRALKKQPVEASQFYYASHKKFIQSNIFFEMPGMDFDLNDEAAALLFNEYFGAGMNSVVFQEIRELRSLGYSTAGRFVYDPHNLNPSALRCYLGTQCDKTREGVEAMRDLMVHFPERADKWASAVEHQVQTRRSHYLTFRQLPEQVARWKEDLGWQHDRREEITQQMAALQMDDLKAFHAKYVDGRPLVVSVVGNAKRFDPKATARLLGERVSAKQLKFKQLFTF